MAQSELEIVPQQEYPLTPSVLNSLRMHDIVQLLIEGHPVAGRVIGVGISEGKIEAIELGTEPLTARQEVCGVTMEVQLRSDNILVKRGPEGEILVGPSDGSEFLPKGRRSLRPPLMGEMNPPSVPNNPISLTLSERHGRETISPPPSFSQIEAGQSSSPSKMSSATRVSRTIDAKPSIEIRPLTPESRLSSSTPSTEPHSDQPNPQLVSAMTTAMSLLTSYVSLDHIRTDPMVRQARKLAQTPADHQYYQEAVRRYGEKRAKLERQVYNPSLPYY